MPKAEGCKPNGYWTLESCRDDAARFQYRSDWFKDSASAYLAARRNGWLEHCCGHMTRKPGSGKGSKGRAREEYQIPAFKECSDCGETMPLELFHKHPQPRDGRMGHCKSCHESRNKDRLHEPAWADKKAIRAIYAERDRLNALGGEKYVVDHIIPCKGKLVSGLHVENNLRVITWRENAEKLNKYAV